MKVELWVPTHPVTSTIEEQIIFFKIFFYQIGSRDGLHEVQNPNENVAQLK